MRTKRPASPTAAVLSPFVMMITIIFLSSSSSRSNRRPLQLLRAAHAFSRPFIHKTTHNRHYQTCRFMSTTDTSTNTQHQQLIATGRQHFQQYFPFPLDDWQLQAGGAIAEGFNCIVCAPTGAGKTVVGEMALWQASTLQQHGIYTTPLKALSNQKFVELGHIFGKNQTALSTGDVSINHHRHRRSRSRTYNGKPATVTVMTTEVYRNMAWRSSGTLTTTTHETIQPTHNNELQDTSVVILDELHYMGHPGRGSVWEECIITSPPHVQIVGLSATLANAPELAAWMEQVTNRTTVLVQVPGSARPVPLRYLYATKDGLHSLFRDPNAGPGAPKGLLGYRGDYGVVHTPTQHHEVTSAPQDTDQSHSGFQTTSRRSGKHKSSNNNNNHRATTTPYPRGLQVNPVLKAAAAKRLSRVQRNFERQQLKWRIQRSSGSSDDDDQRGGRRNPKRNFDNNNNNNNWKPLRKSIMSPREEKREKERLLRNEMRRAVPSIYGILNRLRQKDLLPAIFFIFSRNGCDEAARNLHNYMKGPRDVNRRSADDPDDEESELHDTKETNENDRPRRISRQRGRRNQNIMEDADGRSFRRGSNFVDEDLLSKMFDTAMSSQDEGASEPLFDHSDPMSSENWKYYAKTGLLDYTQVREVASRIAEFNAQNEEIAFDEETAQQFMYGVGSHHAGMLPAHKSFVESLFRSNLMFVVFATETLAAGINMPARTTVICAMAKRGGDGSSMKLLPTSDLLQMAGRAGRRGMDTDGTCVIVATPFETHDDAVKVLTDPIKPIDSQFSPSYGLAVNLISRGDGKLDVAKQLVSKSFAMWKKREAEQDLSDTVEVHGDGVNDMLLISAQEKFMSNLIDSIQHVANDENELKDVIELLSDRESLKKASKSFLGLKRMLELEETTLQYLEGELRSIEEIESESDADLVAGLLTEDRSAVLEQIEIQRDRVKKTTKEAEAHHFETVVRLANEILSTTSSQSAALEYSLRNARAPKERESNPLLTSDELLDFAKSVVIMQRKTRKLANNHPELDTTKLLESASAAREVPDNSWDDMLAITRTLVAYGCLTMDASLTESDSLEDRKFSVTQAGVNVGMLGFDNSLWALVALGGTYDIVGASAKFDSFRNTIGSFDEEKEDGNNLNDDDSTGSQAQAEAQRLIELLRILPAHELAGYVSSLVADSSRNNGPSVLELFERLSADQQRVIQQSLLVMERLADVQRQYAVDEITRNCSLDISNCEVVTAWAGGCTWNEALQISGAAPGDLARTLSRALDAVRQLGNLPYAPVRGARDQPIGIHSDIRRRCREAAQGINRYPVKDPLAFGSADLDSTDEATGVEEFLPGKEATAENTDAGSSVGSDSGELKSSSL